MSVKPQITQIQLQRIINKDKKVIEIKKKIEILSSKITLTWNLLLKATEYIETFHTITNGNIELLEKLEKENTRIYKKYKEYGDQYDDLEEDLDDAINIITEKYDIIKYISPAYIMTIAPGARGIKQKTKIKRKAKKNTRQKKNKNTRQKKNKNKDKKKMWYEKLFM